MPVALVSAVVPPSWSGSAVLISRLLDGEDPDAYRLLTSAQGRYEGAHIGGLATPCFRLPPARTRDLSRNNKLLYASSAMAGAGAGIVRRAYGIARIARRERCRAIVVFTGDFYDVPAAHVSARLLRVPLYVYMLAYYSHRELYEPAWKRLSPPIERVVVRRARRVICGTDTLARALAERYGVQPAVIHHPADLSLYLLAPRPRPAPARCGSSTRERSTMPTSTRSPTCSPPCSGRRPPPGRCTCMAGSRRASTASLDEVRQNFPALRPAGRPGAVHSGVVSRHAATSAAGPPRRHPDRR